VNVGPTKMHTVLSTESLLVEAFAIVEDTPEIEDAVAKLRDALGVDHVVYHSSKLEASPLIPYIRLTYPASWIKRYLQMGYGEVDPIVREGFKRALPFDWNELTIGSAAEKSFLLDAATHGIGPHGYSVPVVSKHGYRGLFTVCSSRSADEWASFLEASRQNLLQIANRLHSRVVVEVFGKDHPRLTAREIECLRWIALGKDATEIAVILNISPHTIRDYLKSVHYKLDCATSAQAVSKAIKLGLLTVYK
jgi:LuxR family transcriptional regulator, quorum-sensing system regulator CinR